MDGVLFLVFGSIPKSRNRRYIPDLAYPCVFDHMLGLFGLVCRMRLLLGLQTGGFALWLHPVRAPLVFYKFHGSPNTLQTPPSPLPRQAFCYVNMCFKYDFKYVWRTNVGIDAPSLILAAFALWLHPIRDRFVL